MWGTREKLELFIGKDWMKLLQCEANNKINFLGSYLVLNMTGLRLTTLYRYWGSFKSGGKDPAFKRVALQKVWLSNLRMKGFDSFKRKAPAGKSFVWRRTGRRALVSVCESHLCLWCYNAQFGEVLSKNKRANQSPENFMATSIVFHQCCWTS